MKTTPNHNNALKVSKDEALSGLYNCIKEGLISRYINVPADESIKTQELRKWLDGAIDTLGKIYSESWYLKKFNDSSMKAYSCDVEQIDYESLSKLIPDKIIWLIERYRFLKYYGDLSELIGSESFNCRQKEKLIRYLPRGFFHPTPDYEGYYLHLFDPMLNDDRDIDERISDIIDDIPTPGFRHYSEIPTSEFAEQRFDNYYERTKNIANDVENYIQQSYNIMVSSLEGF
ncbi:MAG: hypothetical protein GY839_18795 [candidate division Zixibacteria bacterium]|nr:hypothetical protein [candidate division Zixibacteria bacterium]